MRVCLVTLGDPGKLSGGYLYHLKMAEAAPAHDAELSFASLPARAFAPSVLGGRAVTRRILETGADVVVLDSIALAGMAPWLRRLGRPIVAMLHQPPGGIDHAWWRTRLQARLDIAAYRRCARILVASESLHVEVLRAGVPEEIMRVVAPGRDVPRVEGDPPELRRGRRIALLYVGNWIERKGLLELLDAFGPLPPDGATLHLVGETSVEPRYERRVRRRLAQADLAGRVVMHGPVPKSRVGALYAAADAFVLPSRREPYGTVYGEAMAAGLPVVGWDAGNLPHLATHEHEGLVVPTGDVGALGAALRRLIEDDDLRTRLGQAARQRAQELPTWGDTARAFFESIREVAPFDSRGSR